MKFRHVTLSVKNIENSLKFYKDIVGLEVLRRFNAGPDTEIVFLGSGDTEVELICGSSASHEGMESGKGISLGFMPEATLEDTIALLKQNGYETDGIIMKPNPSTSFFFARDPDGYNIQFIKG